MESTGVYHQQLADYLYSRGRFVSVLNALVIKRYIQMHMRRVKTDKADAAMICRYAMSHELRPYQSQNRYIKESRTICDSIDLLIKNRTMLKNRLHALGHKSASHRRVVLRPLENAIQSINQQINVLEKELNKLIANHDQDLFERLQTIPGIGKSTAMFMIVISDSFQKFESARQLSCYVGLTPTERNSGSSIRGKSRISKRGNGKLRNLLFMCSFNACKHNKDCRELYERMIAKGKSKKLALIAVSNKLIKQAYAIGTSGLVYDENFRSVKPRLN